jgi:hypothetical protein
MSGGNHEYMAAFVKGALSESGFDYNPISKYGEKYFDLYNENSNTYTYNNRILGDATGEVGPFYYYADNDGEYRQHNNWGKDYSYFVDTTSSWMLRGGSYMTGALAGQLHFNKQTGAAIQHVGFRLVLS